MAEGNNNQNQQTNEPNGAGTQQSNAAVNPQQLADALLSAVEARQSRAASNVAKSFAQQYGMSETEINAILTAAQQKKAAQLTPEAQAQVDRANNALKLADVRVVGAEMGLQDAATALLLMPQDAITIDDKGAVQGTKKALEALQKEKPFIFKSAAPRATGMSHTGGNEVKDTKKEAANAALRSFMRGE